jgi:hypothetical protein
LTKALEQNPVSSTLQTTSDLWYLDNPGSFHTAGQIEISVESNGNNYVHAALALSGTAPGFLGASAIAIADSTVNMNVSSPNSMAISWLALGGSGNTAGTATSIKANSPASATTFGGAVTGGNYAGHVLARTSDLTAGAHTFSFNTGLTDVLCLAAEFLPAEVPASDYQIWAFRYPGADVSDPDADFDGDGLTNDEERLFGLDPTSGSSANPIKVPLNAAAGTLSYTRRDDALTQMNFEIWTSTDLAGWVKDDGAGQTAGTPDANDIETVAVQLSPTLLTEPKLFVRVRAIHNGSLQD